MKIIEHGRKPGQMVRRFVCIKCGCVFDANDTEYKYIDAQRDPYYICACPECGKDAYSYVQHYKEY